MNQKSTALPVSATLVLLLLLSIFLTTGLALAQPAGPDAAGAAVDLTLLHNNDGESALLEITNTVAPGSGYPNTQEVDLNVGSIAAFKTLVDNEIAAARGQGNAVVNVYAGDAFLASSVINCSLPPENEPIYDAIAQRQIPYTAHVFGNHEFDFNPDFTQKFIETFDFGSGLDQPFLSANLDFSAEAGYAGLIDADGLIVQAPASNRPVARSMVYKDPLTGADFGIVAATTYLLPTISSPRNVTVTTDMATTAAAAQQEIDRLIDDFGINKIIFVSHMQDLDNDRDLLALLSGVDIAVGGGGDEILVNPSIPVEDQLLPGEEEPVFGDYPVEFKDKDGKTVYGVVMNGNYKYLGRLDVRFDASGVITEIDAVDSYPRRVIPNTPENAAAIADLGLSDAVTPNKAIIDTVVVPVEKCLEDFSTTNIAFSEVPLNLSRTAVRGDESNAGNLIADSFIWAYKKLGAASGVTVSDKVVAAQNGGGIRQNAGDNLQANITRQNTLDILPFANDVVVIEDMEPATLIAVFEHAVSAGKGNGRFLQVAGVKVVYNLMLPIGDRVVSLKLADGTKIVEDGDPVAGAPKVDFVANSFTAGGGDEYDMLAPLTKVPLKELGNISYERAWIKYMTEDMSSFPIDSADGLPHIKFYDPRYVPGGEGRIRFQEKAFLPVIMALEPAP